MQKPLHNADFFLVAEAHILDFLVEVERERIGEFRNSLGAILLVKACGIAQQINCAHVVIIKHFAG
ncbi:hypothetical protein SDC9_98916 [bioreactor metagenome]|uniref:Uncharacterized protein n=1 Tax=bioreactor metagenome TaxID=1076179 RepID=A0A645AG38_9ZZZZ